MTEAVVFFDCALSKWYEDDSTSTASITAIYASTGSDDFTVFIFPASQRISDVASSVTGLHLECGQMHLAYMRGGPYEPVPAVPEKEGLAEFAEFLAKHGKDLTLLAHNAPSIQCLVDAIFRSDLKTQMVFRTLIRELVTAAPDIRHHLKLGPLDWDTSDNQATIAQLGRDFKVPRREDEFLPAYRVRVLRPVIYELGIDSFPRGQRQQLQLAPLDLDTQIKIVLEQIMGRSGITKKTE